MKKTSDRDRVIRIFTQYLMGSVSRRAGDKIDSSIPGAKEFLTAMASWAGKGKDELVQVICREIGSATAMVLKEPLSKVLENKRIQITIELVPNETSNKKNGRKKPQSASKISEGKTIQLTLDSVAFGGDALTRLDGKVYFVADALPGETVETEIVQDKERFAKARVTRRLQPAPYAVAAPVPMPTAAAVVSGNRFPYDKQLQWKAGFIQDALQRIGGIAPDTYPLQMQASPEAYHYRNRIDIKWQIEPNGSVTFGYFAKSSHALVAIDRCLIADPAINQVLADCRKLHFPSRDRVFVTSLELQVIADGRVLVSAADAMPGFWQDLHKAVAQIPELAARLIINDPAFVCLETWEDLHFHTRAGQFQQVNLPANRFLRGWVRQLARQYQWRTIVDLYCGSGNLSLALAKDGLAIYGVEAYEPSILAAQYNSQINGLQTHYAAGDAQDIGRLFPDRPALDLLIVDPPRRGMAEAVPSVLALRAANIIYVSCDPNTLARDLKQLLEHGYKLTQVMGLDFFRRVIM